MDPKKIPNKLFFKIGEVCEITDTQPYVLRYWESEFPALAPAKNSSGQRIYRRRDIETVLRIKQLLYDEGFTIGRVETPQPTPTGNGGGAAGAGAGEREAAGRDDAIKQLREGLREILTLLERNDRSRV
jgi:DNA-binding transcriptional MerR regulator